MWIPRSLWRLALVLVGAAVLVTPQLGSAQSTGRVVGIVRGESNQPLAGVSVLVMGTRLGALSGADGRFTIPGVPVGARTLRATILGYADQTRTVTVGPEEAASVEFALTPQAVELQAVVAVGYATQKARDVTGSVATVTSNQLDAVATTSVNQMLAGKAPGLAIQTISAQPGGAVNVNIRGAISPLGNNTPLYVIDGVPITEYGSSLPSLSATDLGFYGGIDRDPLAGLNPNDIESVTVLKDASAAAIYGSAAANGVVLITTKAGRAGAIHVDYTGTYSVSRPQDYFPMMNAQQFMTQQSRLAYDYWLYQNKVAPYGTKDPSTLPAYIPLFTQAQINAPGTSTDWLGLVMRDGHAQEHNVSLSGGSANTFAYASFNYRTDDAVLKNSTLNRYSGRINLRQTISPAVSLTVKANASQLSGNNASTGSNSGGVEKYNMLQAAMAFAPTITPTDQNGNYNLSYNPLIMNPAAFLTISDYSKTSSLFVTPDLEINFLPSLKANIVGQINQQTSNRSFYLPTTANNVQAPDGMAQKAEGSVNNYSTEGYLTYQRQFRQSDLTVVAGAGWYQAGTEGSSIVARGFFTDAFGADYLSVSNNLLKNQVGSYKTQRTKLSQFGRVNYTLKDRYILALVARRDGSSIFAPNHRWGIFPGVSAAWVASDEPFVHDRLPMFSQLKLRFGYGVAGNESVLAGNTLQLYSPATDNKFLIGNTLYSGVALSQVANPNLTWEKTATLNAGVDFGVWKQRVSGSVDYFVKTASDLLQFNRLPSNNAVGQVADNVGSTRSRGFEVALHTRNIEGSWFHWNTDLNFSHYYAYWVTRNPAVNLNSWVGVHDAMDAIYGWQTDGIIRSEADRPAYQPNSYLGNIRYVDQNGDGKLDAADVVQIGNRNPRWIVGMNNNFTIGRFDVTAYVYGNLGFKRSNNFYPSVGNVDVATNPQNTTIYAADVWSETNPNGTLPGVAGDQYANSNPSGSNDFNLKDASFLRLRNVTIGYSVPPAWLGERVRSARVFVDLQDLGVLTNYPGFDPEYTEANPYPKAYTVSLGVQANF